MKYQLNNNNEFTTAERGNKDTYNYNTNQMCTRCEHYKKSSCLGKQHEMYKPSFNHYCKYFKDRLYTNEQQNNGWHLSDFVKNFNKM